MKTAINNDGIEVQVSDDTPVNTTNGIHYLLTPVEEIEISIKEQEWASKEPERVLADIYTKRIQEYGTPGEQFDIMYHEGFEGWKTHITQIKLANPKP